MSVMASSIGTGMNNTTTQGLHSTLNYDGKAVVIEEWLLVGSPAAPLISVLYLVVVWLGMRWMKERPPFQLTTALRLYNLFQICLNLFILSAVYRQPREASDIVSQSCAPDLSRAEYDSSEPAFLLYFWGYLLSKVTDLSDTIFFVLRKKNTHISFLHLYHHTGMVFFTWITLRYTKAHQSALPGCLNVFVHVVMYTYYFLATFGPGVQRYLWWKRHLTKLQLGQFTIILLYFAGLYYNDCPISRLFSYIWVFNVTFVFALFVNFYIKTYIIKRIEMKNKTTKNK